MGSRIGLGLIGVPSASIMESRVERMENHGEARVVSGLQEVRDWVMGCSKEWKSKSKPQRSCSGACGSFVGI